MTACNASAFCTVYTVVTYNGQTEMCPVSKHSAELLIRPLGQPCNLPASRCDVQSVNQSTQRRRRNRDTETAHPDVFLRRQQPSMTSLQRQLETPNDRDESTIAAGRRALHRTPPAADNAFTAANKRLMPHTRRRPAPTDRLTTSALSHAGRAVRAL